jgi:RNA recognition motif-containing protein
MQGTVKSPSKQRSSFGIWVGNLPFSATKDDLRNFFRSRCLFEQNEITRIHLPNDLVKQKGKLKNKGFAYVDFSTRRAMEQAIILSEQLFNGRRVLIKNATSFKGRPDMLQHKDKASKTPANNPSQRVFIGNLGFEVTKEALEQHFKPCGPISDVHVATFEDSGKCKGYAWVEFEKIEAAEAAVRGFVEVPGLGAFDNRDPEGCCTESPGTKAMRLTSKKIWVNRIMGRPLRMEFAEDRVTRYRKRFGKKGILN